MSISAVLSEVTLLLLLEVLAHLRLVVVVRDVEHLVLNLNWKLLIHAEKCKHLLIVLSKISQDVKSKIRVTVPATTKHANAGKASHYTLRPYVIELGALGAGVIRRREKERAESFLDTYFIFASQFIIAVSEVTAIPLDAVLVLRKMLTKRSLIEVVELLALALGLLLHNRNWDELGKRWLPLRLP